MSELDLSSVKHVRIHPAIGFARVGNSTDPDGYFLGPEVPGIPPEPADGRFKDAQGRIKRQAVRFRCYGYDEKGERWVELTDKPGHVSIEWTVRLANLKAAAKIFVPRGRETDQLRNKDVGREELVIKPKKLSLDRPGLTAVFEKKRISFTQHSADVCLGEIRTEPTTGRLLVLGGSGAAQSPEGKKLENAFNNDGWWDDTSDGPVDAVVTINGKRIQATRAWVVVTPPKYAPGLDNPVTLWERLRDQFSLDDEMAIPSYTEDIAPVLRRARFIGAVNEGAAGMHSGWPEPIYGYYARRKIYSWLRRSTGDQDEKKMPRVHSYERQDQRYGTLTPVQLRDLRKWRDGAFVRDWPAGGPRRPHRTVTPRGLDRAALEACVGESFTPGIEAGAFFKDLKNWAQPYEDFRFAPRLEEGAVTERMAIPWQADFWACADNWWPVPRPNQVVPGDQPELGHQEWTRAWAEDMNDMPKNWDALGFVRPDGEGRLREVERHPEVTLAGDPLPDGQLTTLWDDDRPPAATALPEDLAGIDLAAYGHAELPPGGEHTWPVRLTEEDRMVEITVRTPRPDGLTVRVVTPYGSDVEEDDVRMTGTVFPDAVVVRLTLPVEVMPARYAREGRWRIVLGTSSDAGAQPVPYRLSVATESGIQFDGTRLAAPTTAVRGSRAHHGDGAEGAEVAGAVPAEHDRRMESLALVAPDGTETPVEHAEGAAVPAAAIAFASAPPGTRLRAIGYSRLGHPFVRERFLTGNEPA
ncbi:LodA/GoxA family CTQ-dependent oxidase [Streptomyces sp. NPDC048331]|uniref:LodA/GoxA family CTQ-dependent oxidase n=1 Tax=Streptomyces sp. NPDC048331 TaxID=3365534 RepID=UPI0037197AD7